MADTASTRATQAPTGSRPARRTPASRPAGGATGAQAAANEPRAAGGNLAIGQALGAGAPLDDTTRAEMQARYGADFSQVRVHAGPAAASTADALHANAYAIGRDIVFGPGRYAPHTREGRRLLAHELAHVVQQSRGGLRPAFDPNAPHERAADRAADAVVGGSGPVAVQGATGVGVAADFGDWLEEKYEAAKEIDLDDVREVASDAADLAGDAIDVAVEYGPYVAGPVVGNVADFQRALVTDIKEEITGVDDPEALGLRETAARKVDFAVGVSKGAASQVADLADTVIWAGSEARDLKDAAIEKTAEATGIDPETAKTIVGIGSVLVAPFAPQLVAADALGGASDAMEEAGWVDEQGKPSLTTKVQEGYDALGDWALDVIDAPKKEEDDTLFTMREKGELVGAVGIQVAGAFVGATEVKVGLALVGALGGIRGIVETMRAHPNDFHTQPSFWSGLLSTALSIVGIKGKGAAKKIIDIALKCGALAQVVPHLWQLYKDYDDPALQADPERYNETLERDLSAVIRAVVDVVMMIARNGVAGRPTPKYKGSPPKAGPVGHTGSEAGVPKAPTAGSADAGSTKPAPGTDAVTAKPPSRTALKKADSRAQGAKRKADSADARAKKAEDSAAAREAAAQKSKARADEQRARAEKNAQTLQDKQAKADERAQALVEAQQKAAANGGDAKAKARLDKKAQTAEKAAADARTKADNAKKRADAAKEKADATAARAAAAEQRAQDARAKANDARAQAKKAEGKAQAAKEKAEALRGPLDPASSFADLNDPAHASPSSGPAFKPNAEPIVWVRTGKGKQRWSYVPEGDKRFGKGEGVAMPKSQADDYNFTPAGQAPKAVPITPRTGANGRPVESTGAGGRRGSRYASASARDQRAVETTSIRPDTNENQAYNRHLDNGEFGILRPQGSNAPGVDSITARIEFDAQGRPVRATIYLNDVTTPTAPKGAKPSHANWQQELAGALDPKAPPGQRLDFGDPAIDAAVRKAAADGNVYIRVVRTEPTAAGHQSVTIDPAETFRTGPVIVPRLPNVAEVRDGEREDEEEPR